MLSMAEMEQKVSVFAYLTGSLSLLFAVFLMIWAINIFSASIDQGYFVESWFYVLFSTLFAAGITLQFILMCSKKNN